MDNLLRLYFALPEVREVLQGASQDPGLGVEVDQKAKGPCPPRIEASAWRRLGVTKTIISQRQQFALFRQFDPVGSN
jgi:hypothetical protein